VHRCSWPDGGGTHLDTGFQEFPGRQLASRPKVRDARESCRLCWLLTSGRSSDARDGCCVISQRTFDERVHLCSPPLALVLSAGAVAELGTSIEINVGVSKLAGELAADQVRAASLVLCACLRAV
jgi:hypothetical protein